MMKHKTNLFPVSFRSALAVSALAVLFADKVQAADGTWTNLSGNGAWATGTNWLDGTIPGATSGTANTDIAFFTGTLAATRISNVDSYRNIGGITFGANNTNFGYALNGGTTGNLFLSAGGVIQLNSTATSGAHTNNINVPVTLLGDATFSNQAVGGSRALRFQVVNGSAAADVTSTLTLAGANTSSNNHVLLAIGDGSNGGKLAVTKANAGTWRLNGANTYTGSTTISGGVLTLGAAEVLPNVSTIVLGGGTLLTGNFTETAGALSMAAASTIDLGGNLGGTSILTFTGGTGFSATNTLSIWNWNGTAMTGGGTERLVIPGLSVADLSNITFYEGGLGSNPVGTATYATLGGGELVPVPEPTGIFGIAAVAAGAWLRRSRSSRRSEVA